VITYGSPAVSLIDLSGDPSTVPTKVDYTAPVDMTRSVTNSPSPSFAAISASQWIVGNSSGVLIDGASLAGTPRFFGYGQVLSVVGGTGYFALSSASGQTAYFDANTLALTGQLTSPASKLALSADGTVLVAMSPLPDSAAPQPVNVYSLPSNVASYTWPYQYGVGTTYPLDIALSASGTVLGQELYNSTGAGTFTQSVDATTGGSPVFATTSMIQGVYAYQVKPPMRLSPDGTLFALSQQTSPVPSSNITVGGSLYRNGTLLTGFSGLPAGWLDDSRLVVNNYVTSPNYAAYAGCTLYGSDGTQTGAPCALPSEFSYFQPLGTDSIFAPQATEIIAVSTGSVQWLTADPSMNLGAAAGSRIVFVSGVQLLAQTH
jgi:hypothetical protein